MKPTRLVLLAGVALTPPLASALAQDAAAIARRAGAVYRSLTALQADFVQTIEDGLVGDTLRSSGRLYQAGPNAFAMRFSDPPDEAIVIDGTYIWIYTPSAAPGQVIRMRMEADPVYGVNLLAKLLDRPAERYRTGWIKADTLGSRRMDVVSIVPRTDNQQFTRAVLWLDASDALPRRIELEESPGVRRILVLTRLRPGAGIPREIFEFRVPRGVRIVDR